MEPNTIANLESDPYTSDSQKIDLSPQQLRALEAIKKWWKAHEEMDPDRHEQPKMIFELTGFAGTGKTTCIRKAIDSLGLGIGSEVLFAAYTGKAASVIRKYNNLPASTIHSLIYNYIPPDGGQIKALEADRDKILSKDKRTKADEAEVKRINVQLAELRQPRFERKTENCALTDAKLLVLDECSMVGREMLDDLLAYQVPIIAIGDPGQLPPVKAEAALFLGNADAHLDEIHRQAEDNPIILWSFNARNKLPIPYSYNPDFENAKALHLSRTQITMSKMGALMNDADQVLAGKRATVSQLNTDLRRAKGFTSAYPQVGDKLICRKNNRKQNLLNGTFGTVITDADVSDLSVAFMIHMDDEKEPREVEALRCKFDLYLDGKAEENIPSFAYARYNHFEYGYAITVHVSQGSQWDTVFLFDDGLFKGWAPKDNPRAREQWLYTGITRAAEKLIIYS